MINKTVRKKRIGVLYEIWWEQEEVEFPNSPLVELGETPPERPHDGSEVHLEVIEALRTLGYGPQRIELDGSNHNLVKLARNPTSLIFNLAESYAGDDRKDVHVAAYLEMLGKAYTGCDPRALHLGQDKALAKKILKFHGIPTPDFAVIPRGQRPKTLELTFPVVVKPNDEDGSIGIDSGSVVSNLKELKRRVEFVHDHFGDALIESFIAGRELNAALIGNECVGVRALPLVEIDLKNLPDGVPKIVGTEVKWWKGTDVYRQTPPVYPKGLRAEERRAIREVSVRAYRALGLRDYARIDLRLSEDGTPFVIEANPNPWLGRESEYVMAWEKTGKSYEELIGTIVQFAETRGRLPKESQ